MQWISAAQPQSRSRLVHDLQAKSGI